MNEITDDTYCPLYKSHLTEDYYLPFVSPPPPLNTHTLDWCPLVRGLFPSYFSSLAWLRLDAQNIEKERLIGFSDKGLERDNLHVQGKEQEALGTVCF